jgi:hypothetical protein
MTVTHFKNLYFQGLSLTGDSLSCRLRLEKAAPQDAGTYICLLNQVAVHVCILNQVAVPRLHS